MNLPPSVLANGLGFSEGPVATQSRDIIVMSVDSGPVLRIRHSTSEIAFDLGGGPNGAAEGADGSIYAAQNGQGVLPPGVDPTRQGPARELTSSLRMATFDGSGIG